MPRRKSSGAGCVSILFLPFNILGSLVKAASPRERNKASKFQKKWGIKAKRGRGRGKFRYMD